MRKLTENERKKLLKPIDIVYKPVSKLNQIINCYLSKSMRKIYRVISDLKKEKETTTAEQCYACNKFFIKKKIFWKISKCLQPYAWNYLQIWKPKHTNLFWQHETYGRFSFSNLFWFWNYLWKDLYAFVVAFHPNLNIEKLFVVKSFNHTFE